MSGCRGQASIESLIAIVFMLFILVIATVIASIKSHEADVMQFNTDARRVTNSLADNINNIAEQGGGFYKNFSVPQRLYGSNEYNFTVYRNILILTSGNYTFSRILITSNATIDCLDKNYTHYRNRIMNDNETVHVICERPELMFVSHSFKPQTAQANVSFNVSISVVNLGTVESGPFDVWLNDTKSIAVPSLHPDERADLATNFTFDVPGEYPLGVSIDRDNAVKESIEYNNAYNGTIRIY